MTEATSQCTRSDSVWKFKCLQMLVSVSFVDKSPVERRMIKHHLHVCSAIHTLNTELNFPLSGWRVKWRRNAECRTKPVGDTHATVAYTGIPALPCLYAYDIALNTPHFRRRGRGGKTPQNMRTLHSTAITDGECTSRKLNCRPICTHFQSSYHENLYIPPNVTTYNFLLPRPVVQD